MNRRICLLYVLTMLFAASASAGEPYDVREVIKRAYKVAPGGTIRVDMDAGNLTVASRRGNEVMITINLIIDADTRDEAKELLADYKPTFQKNGNNITVSSRYDRKWKFWSFGKGSPVRVQMLVTLPPEYHINFDTGAGNVELVALMSKAEGRTGAGDVTLRGLRSPAGVSTGTGNVRVENVTAPLSVSTGAGNVRVTNAVGKLTVSTGAGNIDVQLVRPMREHVSLSTGAGNVNVRLAPNFGFKVDASTGIGSADTNFPLHRSTGGLGKTLKGAVNGGGADLHLSTGVGNISVRSI